MSRSLVLNATYEPLSVVSSRRALLLVLASKAEAIESSDHVFRSERASIAEPTVVRLSRFVRVPYPRRRALNRRTLFVRDAATCQYCGDPAESIDHVIPRSRGGEHVWENVVAACKRCNAHKRDHLLSETSMCLRRPPRAPAFSARLVLSDHRVPESWAQYLDLDVACSA